MDDSKQQIVDRLQKANNVLVTVSNNPSVDQLAACIGLTVALNKLDKHATAVFSGAAPSTIEFLKPEETLEKNTDSLRDFIISLDKAKADKLRYKVEDRVVRIFITPYKTSISDQDLEFSQGDFNVDVVLALGVQEQKDLDQAITAHGRILHDATVVTINTLNQSNLGSINWAGVDTSSLSEMITTLVSGLGQNLFDEQISTALLTGIVAETDRFSNEKTSADTMKASAALMAAGANQQLVATKLQEPIKTPAETPLSEDMPSDPTASVAAEPEAVSEVQISDDGTLEIDHDQAADEKPAESPANASQSDDTTPPEEPKEEIVEKAPPVAPSDAYTNPRTALGVTSDTAAPTTFTSAALPEEKEEPLLSPLDLPPVTTDNDNPDTGSLPLFDQSAPGTLQDLEQEVHSPHLNTPASDAGSSPHPVADVDPNDDLDLTKLETPTGIEAEDKPAADINAARDAVAQAMAEGGTTTPEPVAALNAQPLIENLNTPTVTADAEPLSPLIQPLSSNAMPTADQPMTMPLPAVPTATPAPASAQVAPINPNAAPSVPPPIIPFQP